ncbi:hypothetical protein D1007_27560 [Hordeum vulgare]|nr:hypothetical protein D1007_27560 [Hordeum vulgare]
MAQRTGGGKTATTRNTIKASTIATMATPKSRKRDGSASRGSSRSPAESKTPDPAASMSARLGSMALLDKEAEGIVFEDPTEAMIRPPRWAAVGKACTTRPLNKFVLERSMQWAWGQKEARFRDLGGNIFEVHFGNEWDWKHAMNNGPWQYYFNVLILKEYDCNTTPSKMIFDKIEVWVQVRDMRPRKRTNMFGEALGNWLGEVIKVDVDSEGRSRG